MKHKRHNPFLRARLMVTIQEGDTLWNLSEEYLRDGRKWHKIARWNKGDMEDPVRALPIGKKILIKV